MLPRKPCAIFYIDNELPADGPDWLPTDLPACLHCEHEECDTNDQQPAEIEMSTEKRSS